MELLTIAQASARLEIGRGTLHKAAISYMAFVDPAADFNAKLPVGKGSPYRRYSLPCIKIEETIYIRPEDGDRFAEEFKDSTGFGGRLSSIEKKRIRNNLLARKAELDKIEDQIRAELGFPPRIVEQQELQAVHQ